MNYELCQQIQEVTSVSVSGPTVCRVLRHNGFSRKIIMQVAKQRRSDFWGAFIANVLQYDQRFFVWVDETGCGKKDHIRKFGYAFRGEPPVYHRLLVRGKRISAIAAICTEGIVDCELYSGTVNGEKFVDFVRGNLIPNMQSFDGTNSRSICILDICSIHHVQEVKDLFQEAGILVFFSPLTALITCQ